MLYVGEAGQLLAQVMLCGGATAEGIAGDEDLRGLPPATWGGGGVYGQTVISGVGTARGT